MPVGETRLVALHVRLTSIQQPCDDSLQQHVILKHTGHNSVFKLCNYSTLKILQDSSVHILLFNIFLQACLVYFPDAFYVHGLLSEIVRASELLVYKCWCFLAVAGVILHMSGSKYLFVSEVSMTT